MISVVSHQFKQHLLNHLVDCHLHRNDPWVVLFHSCSKNFNSMQNSGCHGNQKEILKNSQKLLVGLKIIWKKMVLGWPSTKFVIPRQSRRDIVLASSVRPHFLSVRNHISVPIGQIWFILGTNDKYNGLLISYKFGQNRPINTWVIALVLV